MTPKEAILAETKDCVSNILFYNRKNDQCCTQDQFDDLLNSGELTPIEIVQAFEQEMKAHFPEL